MDNIYVPSSETQYPLPFSTSPLFPLLYLSLLSQRHAPRTTTEIYLEYDYIIVGAGSAGSTLAGRLSEVPCVNVLLLEAGKSPPKVADIPAVSRAFLQSDLDWGYFTEPQEFTGRLQTNNKIYFPLGKAVGGSSALNGMLYNRGHRDIFDEWAAMGATGWSYRDLLPYFIKMEDNQNPEDIDIPFHGFGGPVTVQTPVFETSIKSAVEYAIDELGYNVIDINGQTQKGFYNYQMTTRHGQRCSAAKAYLVPAENRTNLHIVERAMVTKIIIENGRAIGVEFDRSGNSYFVRASREVIVSCGTIKTAQLLLLSGIGPWQHLKEHNIPLVADLPVGCNFHDHIAAIHTYYSDKLFPGLSTITDPRVLRQYINERTGPLAAAESVQYVALLTNERYTNPGAVPDYQLYLGAVSSSGMAAERNIIPEVYEAVYKPYENKSQLFCISQYLRPRGRGFVKLRSADPYDAPIINPRYFSHPEDLRDVVEGLKECDRISATTVMRQLGVKPIENLFPGCDMYNRYSEEYLACEAQSIVMTTSHLVGTVKMGNPYDPSTVVDPELRVKGVKGLRVVDASVMPIVPTANTNVPVITLAEKAADIIKGAITCNTYLYN